MLNAIQQKLCSKRTQSDFLILGRNVAKRSDPSENATDTAKGRQAWANAWKYNCAVRATGQM
jgi:orotidine-5'-phosphate decarboxylase